MPPQYEHHFRRTLLLFLHQRVWDPRTKALVHLRPLGLKGVAEGNLDYLGPDMDAQTAQGIAEGGRKLLGWDSLSWYLGIALLQ